MNDLQLQLLEKTAFLQRYSPESIAVIETQLGIAQKNILAYISTTENQAKIRAFISKEVESAFSTFDTILNDDIKEISELAYVATGAVVANYVSDPLAQSFKGWENIASKAKKKIQDPNRPLFGSLMTQHKQKLILGTKINFNDVILNGIDNGIGMQEMSRNLRNKAGLSRKNATTLARTSVFQAINESQAESMDFFEDEIEYYYYNSVLDSRTSDYCLNKNGKKSKVRNDITKLLNYHYNCRSSLGVMTDISDEFLEDKRNLVLWDGKTVNHQARTGGGTSTKFSVDKVKKIDKGSTPNQIFSAMGSKYQRERLGNYRYNLYKNEGYSYTDLLNKDKDSLLLVRDLKNKLSIDSVKAHVPKPKVSIPTIDLGYNGRYNDNFKDITDNAKLVIHKLPKPSKITTGAGGFIYQENRIIIPKDGNLIALHEYGHHLDHSLIKKEGVFISTTRLKKASDLDLEFLGLELGNTKRSKKLTDLSNELMHDVKYTIEKGKYKGVQTTKHIAKDDYSASFSGLIDNITEGDFRDYYRGSGHGTKYFKSETFLQQTENFADLFSLWSDGKKWNETKKMFPNMTKEFESIMKEVLDD